MSAPERSVSAPGAQPHCSAATQGPLRGPVLGAPRSGAGFQKPLWATPELLDEVRTHIAALRSQGVGMRRVGEVSGVGRSRVGEIFHGTGPKKRVKWSTAERILAITAQAATSGALVPAAGTWRLIDEMLTAGATKERIARHLGYRACHIQFGRHRITRKNADAVRRLHDAFFRGSPKMRAVCNCPWFRAVA